MAEITLMQTGERLTRLGHALNRIRRQLRGAGLLEESESIRVAARECWRADRFNENPQHRMLSGNTFTNTRKTPMSRMTTTWTLNSSACSRQNRFNGN